MGAETPPVALDRPGAGLPPTELWISRALFAFARVAGSRASALRGFASEAAAICAMVDALDDARGARRVLVPRLLGLEDSSRHWSPFMVVQHLVIVDTNMFRIMTDLVAGRPHPDAARIENFKPSPSSGRQSLDAFRRITEEIKSTVPRWPDLRTAWRHAHPWFGPLDAWGWLCLAGLHHSIHRRQLAKILALA